MIKIKNELYNPELAMGNSTEFYSYYKAFCTLSETQIKETITSLNNHYLKQDKKYNQFCDEEIKRMKFQKGILLAIKYHLSHPCFSSIESLLINGIKYPSDVGRFPELFIIRFIIPYLVVIYIMQKIFLTIRLTKV